MGDQTIVEIKLRPKRQNVDNMFYKVNSSAVIFEVMTSGFVGVGLAYVPDKSCIYWIIIGDPKNNSHIKEGDYYETSLHSKRTPNILSASEFRKFWIRWDRGFVRFGGAEDMSTPILEFKSDVSVTKNIRYFTFASGLKHDDKNYLHIKFNSPPAKLPLQLRSLNVRKPEWVFVDMNSTNNKLSNKFTLPQGALIGGYEEEPLYIMRAQHQTSLTPGKLVASQGLGYLSWGGVTSEKKEFEVLCGANYVWEWTGDVRDNSPYVVPPGAVQGGYSEGSREPLYIGRANHNGNLIPGKVQPSHGVCYIAYQGKEIGKTRFQMLISPDQKMMDTDILYVCSFESQIVVKDRGLLRNIFENFRN